MIRTIVIVLGSTFLIIALGFFGALILYPDALFSRFITPRITEAFTRGYPGATIGIDRMRYNIFRNQFTADAVTVRTGDSSSVLRLHELSVAGTSWISLLLGGTPEEETIEQTVIEAKDMTMLFPRAGYSVRCGAIRISVPDSSIVIDSLSIAPAGEDEEFFARSAYRATRYRVVVPRLSLFGAALFPMAMGKAYSVRSVLVHDLQADILVNKDKADRRGASAPPMPGELLASLHEELRVDTLRIMNASLVYGERFGVRGTPAVITFDKLTIAGTGIRNHGTGDERIVFRAGGNFMRSAPMNIVLTMPAGTPDFSLRYTGSLGRMDVSDLNVFLEKAEKVRVQGGIESARFDIAVVSGRASGYVQIVYHDLSFAFIDAASGSSNGFTDLLTSFIANTFTIRSSNRPDRNGLVKPGRVNYARTPEDPFFRFVWFALRSGVRDIAGF
jgi:hypothetical protein